MPGSGATPVGDTTTSNEQAAEEEAAAAAQADSQTTAAATTTAKSGTLTTEAGYANPVGAPTGAEVAAYTKDMSRLSDPSGTVSMNYNEPGTTANPIPQLNLLFKQLQAVRNQIHTTAQSKIQQAAADVTGKTQESSSPGYGKLTPVGVSGQVVAPDPTGKSLQEILSGLPTGKTTLPATGKLSPNLGADQNNPLAVTTKPEVAVTGPTGSQNAKLTQAADVLIDKIKSTLSQIGVKVPADVSTPDQILNMKLPPQAQVKLDAMGYNGSTLGTVRMAVTAPAPDPRKAAVGAASVSGTEAYQAMVKAYSQNPSGMYAQLQSAGLLNPNYSGAQQVSYALQNLVDAAQKTHTDPTTELTKTIPDQNATVTGNMPGSDYLGTIQQIASQYGVSMTPEEENAMAQKLSAEGYAGDSTGDATAREAIAKTFFNPTSFDPEAAPAGSYASVAVQNAQQVFATYGITPTSQQLGSLVQNILLQGPDTEYTVSDEAQQAATAMAKQQTLLQYPALASQINSGTTLEQLTQPYTSVLSNLTGMNTTSILSGPQAGLVTKALSGGQNGQPMTQAQFEQQVMTDPAYGYGTSQTGLSQAASLGGAIRSLLGGQGPENANPGYWSYSTGAVENA